MHTCPDCGQACYCRGDIDDCDLGESAAQEACECCSANDPDDPDGTEDWV